jgi:hypothetical protein
MELETVQRNNLSGERAVLGCVAGRAVRIEGEDLASTK